MNPFAVLSHIGGRQCNCVLIAGPPAFGWRRLQPETMTDEASAGAVGYRKPRGKKCDAFQSNFDLLVLQHTPKPQTVRLYDVSLLSLHVDHDSAVKRLRLQLYTALFSMR